MPDGPVALLHFILLSALRIRVADTLGGGPAVGETHVSVRKLTSIIAYTVLTNDVLVSAVHLFGDTLNTITIWGYYDEFLFLRLRVCQLDSMVCHALGINIGSFYILGLHRHVAFLQGIADLEPCPHVLYSFVHFFIPPPGFWFPLEVFRETTTFSGHIKQGIRCGSLFLDQVLPTGRPLPMANSRILSPSTLLVPKPWPPWASLNSGWSTNVTVPITNWDMYLSGWDLGNNVLQLVI